MTEHIPLILALLAVALLIRDDDDAIVLLPVLFLIGVGYMMQSTVFTVLGSILLGVGVGVELLELGVRFFRREKA